MICSLLYFYCDRFRPKKTTTQEWEGMGVILPGVERDGIFPQFFHGIGTGRDYFLWEWDGRGLKIHSRVTLYSAWDCFLSPTPARSREVLFRTHTIPLYIHSLFTRCLLWIIFFPTRPFPLNLDLVSRITNLNFLYWKRDRLTTKSVACTKLYLLFYLSCQESYWQQNVKRIL